MPTENAEAPQKLCYSVPELARLTGLSRSNTYDLVQRGLIPAKRVRGRWLIPVRAVNEWLGQMEG